MTSTNEITQQILGAWDEVAPPAEEEETPTEETPAAEAVIEEEVEETSEDVQETAEQVAEEDAEAEQEDQEGDDEAAAEEQDEEEVTAAYQSDDPRIQAFLAKYQGDLEKALAGAVQLQQTLGRLGQDKAVLTRQIQELQQELRQAQQRQVFGQQTVLSSEQRQWASEALESGNPAAYIGEAINAQEFGLARAITDAWAEDAPYEAARLASAIDYAEANAQPEPMPVEQPAGYDSGKLLEVLSQYYPDLPAYEQQMLGLITTFGNEHPFVEDVHSPDPERAARGVIGLYEIARAQSTSAQTTREQVQRDGRQKADDARRRAVVSSARTTTPVVSETPRQREIMPGLTFEALEEELDRGK